MAETYPLPQVAYLLRDTVRGVEKTVGLNEVEYDYIKVGKKKVRALDIRKIVFISWAHNHRNDVKPALRLRLYTALNEHNDVPRLLRDGDFSVSLDKAFASVKERLVLLNRLDTQVSENAKGDKLIKGTSVEVYRISALLDGGMSIEDVMRDYPSLDREQIVFAQAYAATHPKPGRPFPKITAKAAMDQMDFDGLELDD